MQLFIYSRIRRQRPSVRYEVIVLKPATDEWMKHSTHSLEWLTLAIVVTATRAVKIWIVIYQPVVREFRRICAHFTVWHRMRLSTGPERIRVRVQPPFHAKTVNKHPGSVANHLQLSNKTLLDAFRCRSSGMMTFTKHSLVKYRLHLSTGPRIKGPKPKHLFMHLSRVLEHVCLYLCHHHHRPTTKTGTHREADNLLATCNARSSGERRDNTTGHSPYTHSLTHGHTNVVYKPEEWKKINIYSSDGAT